MQPATPLPPINLDVQKQIGRLLAKENIRIMVGDYSTAFFDVKNRVLGLPAWNTDNKDLSDLLISHEIGHALFTPEDAIETFKARFPGKPFDVCNIVEDIRIERKIQDVYPGLAKTFKGGYSHLSGNDFFGIAGKDINKLGFLDRLNLKGKLRDLVSITFSEWEQSILDRAKTAETFEEVLELCQEIIDRPEDPNPGQGQGDSQGSPEEEETPKESEGQQSPSADEAQNKDSGSSSGKDTPSGGSSEETQSEGDESEKEESSEGQTEGSAGDQVKESEPGDGSEGKEDLDQTPDGPQDETEEKGDSTSTGTESAPTKDRSNLTASTTANLEKALESLQTDFGRNQIVNTPTPEDFMKSVIPIKDVLAERRRDAARYSWVFENNPAVEEGWKTFKASTKKNVSTLVQEFERKKSAWQYSRAATSNVGSIDVNKLHSYKYTDQIFKSVTTLADAKSHGMIFFIDMSGSMASAIGTVIDQTIQLVFFCKAVGIPYEVYGFTSGYLDSAINESKIGVNVRFEDVQVVELLNSSLPKKEWETAVKELWWSFDRTSSGYSRFNSRYEAMGSTPLYHTIIIGTELIRRFKARHGIQKMNTIFLTDGASCDLFVRWSGTDRAYVKGSDLPKNRQIMKWGSKTITLGRSRSLYTDLVTGMKEQTGTEAICFYLPTSGTSGSKTASIQAIIGSSPKEISWDEASETLKKLSSKSRGSKERVLLIPGGFGFDGYFVFQNVKGISLASEASFAAFGEELDYDANTPKGRNGLASAFTHHAAEKKAARVFLNRFAEMVS